MKTVSVLIVEVMLFAVLLKQAASGMPGDVKGRKTVAESPRIVNIINFIRSIEPRSSDPGKLADVLYAATKNEIEVMNKNGLHGTFLIQYDAMLVNRYQQLLMKKLDPNQDEIGAWLEIVQPLVEKAGLKWRGRFPWDWYANVGFSIGYTPREREKLVDVFMRDFKSIFGRYPESVGSWLIDAHTLSYLSDKYHIVASCNCKEQVGTDGYTTWGGYWNQAYYPSRRNMLMPAQTIANQVPVPVFKMLGSDPIYQYDANLGSAHQGVVSLEPVYKGGGGSPGWVRWFFDTMINGPCLAFNYAQVGQENSFTWPKIEKGYTDQVELLARLQKEHKVRIETLRESGKWFRSHFKLTPASSVTALKDWKNKGHASCWYDSRFYRANFYWEGAHFRIRDIHMFNENYASRYLTEPVKTPACTFDTLPVLDGFLWSTQQNIAGIRLIRIKPDGSGVELTGKNPVVAESGSGELTITWHLDPGGIFTIICAPESIKFKIAGSIVKGSAAKGGVTIKKWALRLSWDPGKNPPLKNVTPRAITYMHNGFTYRLRSKAGSFKRHGDDAVWILPGRNIISLDLDTTGTR